MFSRMRGDVVVSGGCLHPDEPETGFPWQLETTLLMSVQTNHWDYLAFTCHFVTGLHDCYEQSFDSWERKNHQEQMLPVLWVLHEAAEALSVDLETAHQFMLYRTLHTRVPDGLLQYYAFNGLKFDLGYFVEDRLEIQRVFAQEWHRVGDVRHLLREWSQQCASAPAFVLAFEESWEPRGRLASQRINAECAADFALPAQAHPVFEVDAELNVRVLIGSGPLKSVATARLLDYVLTDNLLPWTELFDVVEENTLRFKPTCLEILRRKMEEEDPSGRIGTYENARCSDESLRLLLRARLMNVAGPPGLWSALGLSDTPQESWQLRVPAIYVPGYESEMPEEC